LKWQKDSFFFFLFCIIRQFRQIGGSARIKSLGAKKNLLIFLSATRDKTSKKSFLIKVGDLQLFATLVEIRENTADIKDWPAYECTFLPHVYVRLLRC
jgi:hypothetical protein